jgi:hypothetical protein
LLAAAASDCASVCEKFDGSASFALSEGVREPRAAELFELCRAEEPRDTPVDPERGVREPPLAPALEPALEPALPDPVFESEAGCGGALFEVESSDALLA